MKTSIVYFANDARQATVTPALWQWDFGHKILAHGLNLPADYEIHIGFAGDMELEVINGDDTGIAIPSKYLEAGKEILMFIYLKDDGGGATSYLIRCPVRKRAKP